LECGGTSEAKSGFGGKVCQNHCVFSSKVTRPIVWPRRDERVPHQVPQIAAAKVGGRPRRGTTPHTHGYPLLAARTRQAVFWNKAMEGEGEGESILFARCFAPHFPPYFSSYFLPIISGLFFALLSIHIQVGFAQAAALCMFFSVMW